MMNSLLKHYAERPEKVIAMSAERPLLKHIPSLRAASSPPEHLPRTAARQRWLKAATSDVDRTGDIMVMSGLDLTNFRKNPQFLWQHGLTMKPVHTLGKIVDYHITDKALYVLAEYAEESVYDFAEQIFRLDEAGYLPANSIGFHPIEWEKNAKGGLTFTKWELVEVSKVELPMNPNAIDEEKGYVDPGQISTLDEIRSLEEVNQWIYAGYNGKPMKDRTRKATR
jgi:hypothetical protein